MAGNMGGGQFMLASQFNRPTRLVNVIALSPLARIFSPYESVEPYIDDPRRAWTPIKDKPFTIKLETSWSTHEFKVGEVHTIDENYALSFIGVANNRFNKEYSASGLVYFDVPPKITAALEFQTRAGYALPPEIQKELQEHIDRFAELSNQRVLTHCKNLYNSLVAGRNQLKEAGKAPPEPNDMELLIAFILRDEIRKQKERRARMTAAWEEAQGDIGGEVAESFDGGKAATEARVARADAALSMSDDKATTLGG